MYDDQSDLDHSPYENAQSMFLGTALCALGVQFLTHAQLATGQTAGMAVLLSYTTGLSFALWFFLINLPFYVLAWIQMGPEFTMKSFGAVALLSGLAEIFSQTITFATLPIGLAAPIAGALVGIGLVIIFRHNASLGGVGVLGLYLQDRTGFPAGYTQLIFDAVLFGAALFVLPWQVVAWSLLGAVITNMIIATNHRKDRYVAR